MPLTPEPDQDLRARHGFGRFGRSATRQITLPEAREGDARAGADAATLDLRTPAPRRAVNHSEFYAVLR
jgi:hypothetical protein